MVQFMRTYIAVLGLAIAASAALVARAADKPLDAETKARVERFEKGPTTINISKYPDGVKENYEVFSSKCSQCHKLSRPINSDYALPEEWSRYIKRMMHKPGSGISTGDGVDHLPGGGAGIPRPILDRHHRHRRQHVAAGIESRAGRLDQTDRRRGDPDLHQVHAAHRGDSAGPAQPGVRAVSY